MMFFKRGKFNAKKTKIDGIVFASKKEANRYIQLKAMEKEGKISEFILQPKFILQEKFRYDGKSVREITYIADFQYRLLTDGKIYVEDVKGFKTTEYKLKKKLFLYQYGGNVKFMEI